MQAPPDPSKDDYYQSFGTGYSKSSFNSNQGDKSVHSLPKANIQDADKLGTEKKVTFRDSAPPVYGQNARLEVGGGGNIKSESDFGYEEDVEVGGNMQQPPEGNVEAGVTVQVGGSGENDANFYDSNTGNYNPKLTADINPTATVEVDIKESKE